MHACLSTALPDATCAEGNLEYIRRELLIPDLDPERKAAIQVEIRSRKDCQDLLMLHIEVNKCWKKAG